MQVITMFQIKFIFFLPLLCIVQCFWSGVCNWIVANQMFDSSICLRSNVWFTRITATLAFNRISIAVTSLYLCSFLHIFWYSAIVFCDINVDILFFFHIQLIKMIVFSLCGCALTILRILHDALDWKIVIKHYSRQPHILFDLTLFTTKQIYIVYLNTKNRKNVLHKTQCR